MTTSTPFEQARMDIASAAPRLYHGLVMIGNQVQLDPGLRMLVNLRASIVNGCAYCIDMHSKDARKAGESEQRLSALPAWRQTPFFDDRERAALALTDAITLISDGHVPREVWDEASGQFEPDELAQLVWAIITINAWNRIATSTRMLPGSYEPR
jgi:AhpD family alkylhydroperoxidase